MKLQSATEHTLVLQQTALKSLREAICQIVREACRNPIEPEKIPPINLFINKHFYDQRIDRLI